MRSNRGKDSGLELAVRRELWRRGVRGYRKNYKGLPGTPDLAFLGRRVAVFLHGCFWHQCPTCSRNLTPKANGAYWGAKLARNVERDAENRTRLEALGFRVITIWECEARRGVADCVSAIIEALQRS